MSGATSALFEELGRRGPEPLMEKVSGTVRFDLVRGKRTEHWLVSSQKGEITVSRKNAAADCVVRADSAVFERVATGELNATALVLRGAIGIEGDLQLLLLFQRLFPGPSDARRPSATAGGGRG
jgi:predicted lipid carrier protein YhbT